MNQKTASAQASAQAVAAINEGLNPMAAWMRATGATVDGIAQETNTPIELVKQFVAGYVAADEGVLTKFCAAVGCSPDLLAPINEIEPASSAVVEAVVNAAQRYINDGLAVPMNLQRFMARELNKGDGLDDVRLPGLNVSHIDMLQPIEDAFFLTMTSDTENAGDYAYHQTLSPVEQLRDMFEEMLARHSIFINQMYEAAEAKRVRAKDAYMAHWNAVQDGILGLARVNENVAWSNALIKVAKDKNIDFACEMVERAPEEIFILRPFWYNATQSVRGRGFVRGKDLPALIAREYKAYNKLRVEYDPLETDAKERRDECRQFNYWRRAGQTQAFLRAKANERHILSFQQEVKPALNGMWPEGAIVQSMPPAPKTA